MKILASGNTILLTLQHFTPAKIALAKMEPRVMSYRKATNVLARITTLDRTVSVSVMRKITLVVTYVLVSRIFKGNQKGNVTYYAR